MQTTFKLTILPRLFMQCSRDHTSLPRYRRYVAKIDNVEIASTFLKQLTLKEREIIKEYFKNCESLVEDNTAVSNESPPTRSQLKLVMINNAIPFVGFGIVDNLILITAGEYIDSTLGATLNISTMAAAALGNILSDIAGIGLAHYVEMAAGLLGIRTPNLTFAQQTMKKTVLLGNLGRALGITVGCLIGMFPLLFYPSRGHSEPVLKSHTNLSPVKP